jgi:predicted AAA+ superfamily ATPase
MLARSLIPLLRRRLRDSPAVALVGPRQSGKTTLARQLSHAYFDLEQESDRLRLDLEWPRWMQSGQLLVLDEAQAWPDVFARLRGAIDAGRRRRGRFLLLGSVSPALMKQVSESLAGRLALCELTPFLASEWKRGMPEEILWPYGGFPEGGCLEKRMFPRWQQDYLTLLSQRDLPHWGLPAKPAVTQRLFRMLALCHGQVWNASQVGRSLGLNYQTVNSYLGYLENAFLIRSLEPSHANLRKRLVKSPKLYWRDSGLLHALLGLSDPRQLLSQPWVGASWEGWVIEQILGHLQARGRAARASYLRTNDGYELDLLLEMNGRLWAFEIKLTGRPAAADLSRLRFTADLIKADRCVLISRTISPVVSERAVSTNLAGALDLLA